MSKLWRRVRWRPLTISLLIAAALAAVGAVIWQRRTTDDILRSGEEALAVRDYPKAREQLALYLESRPRDARARLLAARTARLLREYYEAAEHLKRCRVDGGDNEAIGIEETLIDVQRGKQAPGLALRERATGGDELALSILEVLIQFDLDSYQLFKARDELSLYLKARPHDLQARLGRGYVWERFLYFADALEDYRNAVADHPDSASARLHLADTLLIVGTPEEALEQYRWIADRWPNRLEVRLGLARCHRRLGRTEEAVQILDALLTEIPTDGESLLERGQLELDRNRPAEAEIWLRRASNSMPWDRRVNYSLFRCLSALERSEAESFAERVRSLFPCLSALERSEAESFAERVRQADNDLRRLDQIRFAVMNKPNDASLRCEGGILFVRTGERVEGIRWLELALRIDPACAAAQAELTKLSVSPAAQNRLWPASPH